MLRFFILSLLLLCMSVVFNPGRASQDIHQEKLKSFFESILERQKNIAKETSNQIITKDNITIEKADDYYAITLPEMTYVLENGSKRKIGIIAINASPTEDTNIWKFSLSLPSPLSFTKIDDSLIAEINIEDQKAGGILNLSTEEIEEFSAQYSDISIRYPEFQETHKIKETLIKHKKTQTQFNLQNIDFENNAGENLASIGDLKLSALVTGEDNKDILIETKMNGINASRFLQLPVTLFPAQFSTKIDIKKLPWDNVWTLIKQYLYPVNNAPQARQVSMLQAMLTLPQRLAESGTVIRFSDTNYGSDKYSFNLYGNIKPQTQSNWGFGGDITLESYGLDYLTDQLKNDDIHTPLQLVKTICPKENEKNICRAAIDNEGRILMNGQDMSFFFTQKN